MDGWAMINKNLAVRVRRPAPPLLASLLLWAGCSPAQTSAPSSQSAPSDKQLQAVKRLVESAAVRDTIGAHTWTEGLRKLHVEGYGLVVGLGQNGSRTCPDKVRKHLAADIRKKYRLGDSRIGLGNITPEMMIDSPDTAVVSVQGEIGAAALSGTKFDLVVQALAGTETTSLEGGRLFTCDLRYSADMSDGSTKKGKVVATGEGPVFINPFAQRGGSAGPSSLRSGKIIGGGTSLESRVVRLKLSTPSYARAIAVQDKINDRFGLGHKIASADSPWQVSLNIPRRFARRELYFLALARHLSLSADAAAEQRRAMQLAAELQDPSAPHDNIGLALEAIGNTVKPLIRALYDHKLPHVNYYAARTGLHMKDGLAVPALTQHAVDPDSPYQMDAIRELGDALELPRAAQGLLKVVDSDLDVRARTLAYEGLTKHGVPQVTSTEVGGQFFLDCVPVTGGRTIVYGKLMDQPRLAVIGNAPLKTPLFYQHPQDLVSINAETAAQAATIVRKTPSGQLSPPVLAPLDSAPLITLLGNKASESRDGRVVGLGLSYSQVLDVVSSLCDSAVIAAEFRLERPGLEDITHTPARRSRPESDL